MYEEYWGKGHLHREDGPADRWWHENGQLQYEEYWVNGDLHREDGPADTGWYENGQLQYEEYHVNGEPHRADGPAITHWDKNGNITDCYFCLYGKEVNVYDVLDEKAAFAWVLAHE